MVSASSSVVSECAGGEQAGQERSRARWEGGTAYPAAGGPNPRIGALASVGPCSLSKSCATTRLGSIDPLSLV